MPAREIDLRGFDYHVDALCRRDPAMRAIVARHGQPRYPRRAAGVKGLVRIILEQQVSMAAAYTLYRRVDAALGGITASKLAETGVPGLRALGLTRQKARYCHALGAAVSSRQLSLAGVARLPDEAAIAALVAMPGIGAWSAAIYLMFSLGRADVWPPGDLALDRVVATLADDDPAALRLTGERWRPHRTAAAFVLWHRYLNETRPG